MSVPQPPPGFKFDPFADIRLGRSLFELSADDWFVPDPAQSLKPDDQHEEGAA